MSLSKEQLLQRHTPAFVERLSHKRHNSAQPLEDLDNLQLQLEPVRDYIHAMWKPLVRTHADLFLDALYDPKVPRDPEAKRLLYISAKEDPKAIQSVLEATREVLVERIICGELEGVSEADLAEIEIRQLPPLNENFHIPDHQHSLMYLPHPYVVPGPRFNEMYNWDTAFVVRGLLQDEKFDLAKAFVENMFYQIEHYGTILNGNRTYYYDSQKSRSQPPLLTGKILGIYNHYHRLRQRPEISQIEWLKKAVKHSSDYYQHWVTKPHLHQKSGLSMYHSELGYPAFEVTHSEKAHYDKALGLLREMYEHQQTVTEPGYQDRKDRYYLEQYYIPARDGKPDTLSPLFFKGDRAMRETGFDPSRRFGFFNVDVVNYLPVCLNSLRHKIEREMGLMYFELAAYEPAGKDENGTDWYELGTQWENRAAQTAEAINEWLWDEGEQDSEGNWIRKPCYHDFNVNAELCEKYKLPEFRDYDFVTSFYPMWVGIASREQAEALVNHLLPRIQCEWGILTSSRQTGSQWDKPFMWAPLVVVAVEALERYDYYRQALEIASGFLKLIVKDFDRTGKLYEKYNGVEGTSDTSSMIAMGYSENVEGFGWTNSAVLELSHAINRLQHKISGVPLEAPDILTTLTVVESGLVRPQYEEEESAQ